MPVELDSQPPEHSSMSWLSGTSSQGTASSFAVRGRERNLQHVLFAAVFSVLEPGFVVK